MNANTVYKEVLMDHYRHPRNYSDVSKSAVAHRGSNPRCGDELMIGVDFNNEVLSKVIFQGRGCSVCMASASMMTESVTGHTKEEVLQLSEELKSWFDEREGGASVSQESLLALGVLREYPARRRCVLLAWEALECIINVE